METLPRLPMLVFELKTSVSSPDFEACLKKIIRDFYQEDPNSYNKEIKELENLRNKAMKVPHDVSGCSLLKRYYAQIHTLQNRFKSHNTSFDIEFAWMDIYKGVPVTGNVDFELDCVMYNIGALHGQLGALDLRNRAENMKVSCTHFQCSAWAFEQLRDKPRSGRSRDMSHDIISFFHQVMLAQAQECILEKSILDKRKASITAKVAAQVIEYYNSALLVLLQAAATEQADSLTEIVGSRLYKDWKKFIEFKITYFSSLCSFYMGNYSEELQKMGERVAWYLGAEQKITEATKQAKSLDRTEFSEAIQFLSDVIQSKIDLAKRENDFVYHQSVPTPDKLTAVKGASLVKGIAFSVTDPEVCGTDIFSRLVPIEAHELASVYSEKKDKLIREVSTKIEDKNQDLASYMSSLQLDSSSLRPQPVTVPDELIEICAAMSVKQNATNEAKQSLKKLEDLCSEVNKSIKEARALITKEEEKERIHQERFGKRAPSMIMVELSKELMKHEETHSEAMQSHMELKNELQRCEGDIQLLLSCSAKDLENLLPTVSEATYDEKTLKDIERLVAKVNEMREQRQVLEKQLRDMLQKDDVLKKVLALPKNEVKEMFDDELKKYDNHVKLLNQNMEAQENILSALTKANAKYVASRKSLLDQERRRKERVEEIIKSYETFHRALSDIDKGIQFYSKFQNIVGRLLARVRSVSRVQEEERAQFLEIQARKEKRTLQYDMSAKQLQSQPQFTPPLTPSIPQSSSGGPPKLRDYLPYLNQPKAPQVPPVATIQVSQVAPIGPVQTPPVAPVTSVYPSSSHHSTYGSNPAISSAVSTSSPSVATGTSYQAYPTQNNSYVPQVSTAGNTSYNPTTTSVLQTTGHEQYQTQAYSYGYNQQTQPQQPTQQQQGQQYVQPVQPVQQYVESQEPNYSQYQQPHHSQAVQQQQQQPIQQLPTVQSHQAYGQGVPQTPVLPYSNQYSTPSQAASYTQSYVQTSYQNYQPQSTSNVSTQNTTAYADPYTYQDPNSQAYAQYSYQATPATSSQYAVSSSSAYPVATQQHNTVASSQNSYTAQAPAAYYDQNMAYSTNTNSQLGPNSVATYVQNGTMAHSNIGSFQTVQSSINSYTTNGQAAVNYSTHQLQPENGVSQSANNNVLEPNKHVSQTTADNVEIKKPTDPVLSQFDPLWS